MPARNPPLSKGEADCRASQTCSLQCGQFGHDGSLLVDGQTHRGRGAAGTTASGLWNFGLIAKLSDALTEEYGKGFSKQSLFNFRKFYLCFPFLLSGNSKQPDDTKIISPVWRELQLIDNKNDIKISTVWSFLSWSHFKLLMRVSDEAARNWYLKEAAEQMWSVRTLDRNISSQYYERLLMSQNKEPVVKEMIRKTAGFQGDKLEFIKNPMIAEFLGLAPNTDFSECKLESAIITHPSRFLIELGKGFSFVARQQLIRTSTVDYFVDLVFYNYILKCFVLIDLKTTRITHQDVGQMDMDVSLYDEMKRTEGDNPTLGIILCSETDENVARYSVLRDNEQLFASKYKLYMPTEKELREEIERQKFIFQMQQDNKPEIE